jgi:hypothetical protein
MTIEAEIAALTEATTDLLEAVNIGKASLDTAVAATAADRLQTERYAASADADATIATEAAAIATAQVADATDAAAAAAADAEATAADRAAIDAQIAIAESALQPGDPIPIADVTGLQTALDGKQPLATVLTNTTAAFTAAQETKLAGIATGATANSPDATLLARGNHTGTQLASTISDLAAAVAATPAVLANTAKITNATHTGDVTGATALTIAARAVTWPKVQAVATGRFLGRLTAGAGDVEELTATQAGVGLGLYAQAASRSGKDANGIFTTVQYRRANNTLIRSSVLSGGTSPAYTTRTETLFDVDGTTVLQTLVFTLGYTNGELTSEDLL